MTNIKRRLLLTLFGALLAGSVFAQTSTAVRVGSKIDTEGKLLGNMIALALEASGIKVENKSSLGNTKIMRGAITAGENTALVVGEVGIVSGTSNIAISGVLVP